MQKFGRMSAILLAGMMVAASLTGCGSSTGNSGAAPAQKGDTAAAKPYKIGVIQLMEHEALDSAYQGFQDGLKEAGLVAGKDVILDFNNAQNEPSNSQTIANKLVNAKCDLILAIGTPAAQAVANVTKEIPILVTAVTDPADAKLVADNKAPGGNVTGTSDLSPVKEQIELIKQLVPGVKTIGALYCSGEPNSAFQVNLAKKAAADLGIEVIDATVSSSNEIQQVTQSLVGKVEAIFVPTDNMVSSGMATVTIVTEPAKIPVIVGEEAMLKKGGLATYGLSYYDLGKLTAKQAIAILKEGKKPAEMPIEYLTDLKFSLNKEMATSLGLEIPGDLLAKADKAAKPTKE